MQSLIDYMRNRVRAVPAADEGFQAGIDFFSTVAVENASVAEFKHHVARAFARAAFDPLRADQAVSWRQLEGALGGRDNAVLFVKFAAALGLVEEMTPSIIDGRAVPPDQQIERAARGEYGYVTPPPP